MDTLRGSVASSLIVHRSSDSGGRRVTAHRHDQEVILGTAYIAQHLIVFLEAAGVADPKAILDDPGVGVVAAATPMTSVPRNRSTVPGFCRVDHDCMAP
ncbi:hypothetical protein ABT052_29130 [Streptomyces sp. NPDC002766]|uniref:hypothetical protein n=1 Tax=Streptomyces sp. NPDC002766 TaxID=3154429 RepID=UPI00332BC0FB